MSARPRQSVPEVPALVAAEQADMQTERAVLGGVLFDRESIPPMRALTPEHFHDERDRIVFRHLARLDAGRRPLDLLTLERSLRDGGDYDAAGGGSMLGWLAEAGALTIPAYMPDYCATLDRLYRKRTGRALALTLADHLGNGHDADAALLPDALALVDLCTPSAGLEPEVARLGDDYRVTYPARGVVLRFAGAHDAREGLRAEVSATVHGRELTPWGRIDLAAPRSRQEKAKAFGVVAPALPWGPMLDEASRLVRDHLRAGEPARELQRAAVTSVRYVAHPIVLDGQVVTLFGKGGSGKSQLAHLLAKSIESGAALPGMTAPSAGSPAIILDWEAGHEDADALATLAATALEVETGGVHYRRMSGALIHHVGELQALFRQKGARVGVVDSMMMACGDTLRDGWESSCIRFFEALRAIGDGISWLNLAHMNKADIRDPADAQPFGSIFTVNESRAVWHAAGVQDGATLTVTLTNTKMNRGALHRPLGLRLGFSEGGLTVVSADPLALPTNGRADLGQRLRVILSTGALTVPEIIEATASNDWAIRKALKRVGAIQVPDTKPIKWAMPSHRTED